jgi:hypothetical protein
LGAVREAFAGFAVTPRYEGDRNTVASMAKLMLTNVRNSLVHSFEPRLARYVSTWCSFAPADRGEWWPIVQAITGWRDGPMRADALTEAGKEFVKAERSSLGNPTRVSEKWLKQNPRAVLASYRRWNQFFEVAERKRFAITPYFKIKRHSILIDTYVLYGMAKEAGSHVGNFKAFKALEGDQWAAFIKTSGLATRRFAPAYLVKTDGVALNVHFRRPMHAGELRKIADAEEAALARKREWAANRTTRIAKRDENERKKAEIAEDQRLAQD